MNKEQLQKNIETKTKELDILKSNILAEIEKTKKEELENQKKKLEEDIQALQVQLDDLKEVEKTTTNNQTNKETQALKDEVEIDSDRSYEIIKGSKMYDKLLTVLGSEAKVEAFALEIDKVVRKYLDQELEGFPNSIKNSMSVGIQFAMMETLIKQGAQGSAEFFTAFSITKTGSATQAFEGLYKAFGKVGSVNEFFVLANKVQNLTGYLSNKKNTIIASKNIPELMNPNQFKTLLSKPIWSNQVQIDKLDITTLLTLNSTNPVDIYIGEDDLKEIVNNNKIAGVITKETIESIQKSLGTADKLLDTRGKFQDKATDLVDKIAGVLDINIPFLGNLGELMGMKFPTDILGERKDGGVLNFVLGVLGFHGGLKGLHRKYIQEKLDDLHIDNTFIAAAYSAYQKNIDATITNDLDTSTWKICALTAPDSKKETEFKAKIPADYTGLKKSLVDNLDTTILNPVMVSKFAPEFVTVNGDKSVVDMDKVKENKDSFIDTYLKYIIPLLADSSDDFITSKDVDKDSFTLAVMGGLIGDKYFIEGVNIGLISKNDFKIDSTAPDAGNIGDLDVINGKIDFSKGNFKPKQIKNINLLIDEMNKNNIVNVNTQIGILSVISKECGFIPQTENSYENISNQEIRKIFGDRLPISENELIELKKTPEKFFDAVYGKDATIKLGRQTGNTEVGDGYKYRGRGFNQITFKNTYKKYGDIIHKDLVGDPDLVNDPIIALNVALAFFKEGNQGKDISTLNFTTKEEAAKTFARINAGNINKYTKYENKAVIASTNFEVKDKVA